MSGTFTISEEPDEQALKSHQAIMSSLWESFCYTAPEDKAKVRFLFESAFGRGWGLAFEQMRRQSGIKPEPVRVLVASK